MPESGQAIIFAEGSSSPLSVYGEIRSGNGVLSPENKPEFDSEKVAAELPSTAGLIQIRAMRWALHRTAQQLLPRERLAKCYRVPHHSNDSGTVALWRSLSDGGSWSAFFGGLQTCGSVWGDPVCAAKVTERRRRDLQVLYAKAEAQGLRWLFVTRTFSHHAGMALADLAERLGVARRWMNGHDFYRGLRRRIGYVGSIRAVEVTWGYNGWHPHDHELMAVPHEVSAGEVEGELRRSWERALDHVGLTYGPPAFKLDDATGRAAAYLAKMGREEFWTPVRELVKWTGKRGHSAHLHPHQLLEVVLRDEQSSWPAPRRAAALFREFYWAFKGRRQIRTSPELRAILGLGEEATDEQLADAHEEQADLFAWLDWPQWRAVMRQRCEAELSELVAAGDYAGVSQLLSAIGAGGLYGIN